VYVELMCGNVSMRYEAKERESMFTLVFVWATVKLLSTESDFKVSLLHRRLVLLGDLVLLLLVRRALVVLVSSCSVFKSL
jgi:hypothetical protein